MKLNSKLRNGVFLGIGFLMAVAASAADTRVVAPDQALFGKTYAQLANEWTNWFVIEPLATHPALDPDGRFCDRNQSGKVWFLASTYEGVVDRTCTIPSGKGIFVSVGGAFVSFGPEFPSAGDPCLQMGTALEQVRCDVNNDVPVAPDTKLQATLDGTPVEDLFSFRAQSLPGGFTLRVPNPSFLTDLGFAPGDRFPAVADGYYLYLKPLSPGQHTLSVRKVNPDQSVVGVNYTLNIQ